jgi:hypothetical protein
MIKPAAGHPPLAYSSPEAVQTTGTVAQLVSPRKALFWRHRHDPVIN